MSEQEFPRFQNYDVLNLVGAGGMGAVYRARDKLGRIVALKVIHDQLSTKIEFRDRFYEEARHLDGLGDHPNIVNLTGLFGEVLPGRDQETLFIVMEYVEGIDVSVLMAGGNNRPGVGLLPAASALPIMRQATDAIAFAHSHGVYHRDIKPSNILVPASSSGAPTLATQSDVKVMDFGIARTRYAPRVTRTGVIGTPEYMAPELFEEGFAGGGEQTDVYALGIATYEMLTNNVPFLANTETTEAAALFQIAKDKLERDPPPPSTHYPPLDEGVEALVMRAIARRPEDRFANAIDLLTAIDAEIQRLGISIPGGANHDRAHPEHSPLQDDGDRTIVAGVDSPSLGEAPEAQVDIPHAVAILAGAMLAGTIVGFVALP